MGSRFVRPDTVRLTISNGDWLLVKRRLTAGEQRHLFSRLVKTMSIDQRVELDTAQVGISTVLAYLIDWSLPEMAIRGQGVDVVTAALDALDTESYNEILAAVTAHEAVMVKEREQEKKLQTGALGSPAISQSPPAAAGDTSGSVN